MTKRTDDADTGDVFRAFAEQRRQLRAKYGVNCPQCAIKRPRASPSILLPQQICKVDKYRDPRPRLTDEQRSAA
jgi:hypothetical protein